MSDNGKETLNSLEERDTSVIKHEKLGIDIVLPEILQGDLETFENNFIDEIGDLAGNGVHMASFAGAVLRSAAKAGWIELEKPVKEMKPNVTQYIADCIAEHVSAARAVPPN